MTCDFKNENLWLMKGDCLKLISRVLKKNDIQTREPKNLRGVKKFNCDIRESITIWLLTCGLMCQLNG